MDLSGISRIAARETPSPTQQPTTARVVKVTIDGVWAAPLGDDIRHPIGPCRGVAAVNDIVLLVPTQERPWVIGGTP